MADEETFHAHIIFSTKGWQSLITPSLLSDIIARLSRNFRIRDAELLIANGLNEHLHILARFRDYQSFSRIVGWSKGECSHWLNHKYPNLGFYWQKGFWYEKVSQDHVSDVITYIEQQLSIHEGKTFIEEITDFKRGQK